MPEQDEASRSHLSSRHPLQLRIARREFGTDSIAAKESLLLRCAIPNSSNQPTILAEDGRAKTDPPTTGNRILRPEPHEVIRGPDLPHSEGLSDDGSAMRIAERYAP